MLPRNTLDFLFLPSFSLPRHDAMRAALGRLTVTVRSSRFDCRRPLSARRHPTLRVPSSKMASTNTSDTRPTIRGVIFDMDGTLTVPNHDFALMYQRVGCVTGDILSEIETWDLERRDAANQIIHEMETEALSGMAVMPHARELCAFLDKHKVPRGLVTRNVDKSVAHFHKEHWCVTGVTDGNTDTSVGGTDSNTTPRNRLAPFSPALSREFKPYKPAPDALLKICAEWNVSPSQVIMVGDSAKDDVVAGNRAGCFTILLDQHGKWRREGTENDVKKTDDNGVTADNVLRGEMVPTEIVSCLSQIEPLLREKYDVGI